MPLQHKEIGQSYMYKIYILLLSASLGIFQGCGVLIVGVAGTAALAAHDRRSTATMLEDEGIELKIADLLYKEAETAKQIHINATSYNHVVLLTGEVLNQSLLDEAIGIVRTIKNVKRVHNEIIVGALSTLPSRSRDTWITSKVKTSMLGKKDFDATRVKVVTESKTVFLMGLVSINQGATAADVARNIEDVIRVVKLFEYIEEDYQAHKPSKKLRQK